MLKRAAALGKKARQAQAASSGGKGQGSCGDDAKGSCGDDARGSAEPPPKKKGRFNLNLKESPLMRWAAKRVSLGAEASLFQEVAAASLEEARQTGHSEGVLTASGSPILGNCSHALSV